MPTCSADSEFACPDNYRGVNIIYHVRFILFLLYFIYSY
jgi:hypothetical protein